MKKTVCLLLLLLTACTTIAPIQTVTPTPMPIATSTAIPPTSSPTIEPTATPDVVAPALNDLQKDGITASHENGVWMLSFDGAEIPNAVLNENGFTVQTAVGEINIPLSEMGTRVEKVEGNLVIKDASGNKLAAWNPTCTTERWSGWIEKNRAISEDGKNPLDIGSTWAEYREAKKVEKAFLAPFPPDTYYPPSDKIITNYEDRSAGDPSTGFTGVTPFGVLSEEDFSRSPFREFVNLTFLRANEAEGRRQDDYFVTQQVADPNDLNHIQGLTILASKEVMSVFNSSWNDKGTFVMPKTYYSPANFKRLDLVGRDVLRSYYLANGFIDSEGNSTGKLEKLVLEWLRTGVIGEELENVPTSYVAGFFQPQ